MFSPGCDQRQRDQTSCPHDGFDSGAEVRGAGNCACCVTGPVEMKAGSLHVGVKDVLKVRDDSISVI